MKYYLFVFFFFFFKQKTAYEMLLCDWSSDVCSSDLCVRDRALGNAVGRPDDGARPRTRQEAEPRVRQRRRLLDARVGADQGGMGRAPGELEGLAGALGEEAVERPRRNVLGAEAVALPTGSSYAPNLVSRSALAITSGIRWWDGRMPRLPAAHARSVKAVTGSAPQ